MAVAPRPIQKSLALVFLLLFPLLNAVESIMKMCYDESVLRTNKQPLGQPISGVWLPAIWHRDNLFFFFISSTGNELSNAIINFKFYSR